MYRTLLLLPLFAFASISRTPGSPDASPPNPAASSPSSPAPVAAVPAGYHQTKLNGHTFTLPEGFTIELAAAPPLADRPIVAALDEKGRLYVCDSSGSNERIPVQMKKKPHRIMRLEDTNGDGKYDKSTVYVANVMFPEGAMWLDGSLYVSAVPHILKFTDTDDDGKADKEEIWFNGEKVGKTVGGCGNDLHGPYLGPDGWIYWCKGGFERQNYTVHGKPFTTRAPHLFRARPDGSGIEPVMTGGMDNPVDIVFTPTGERIFSCTFLQHPAGGKRDGLIHAIYGGVYGKDWSPVYEHPWTSPHLMEPLVHLGPAAPCGLHRYHSNQFGKEYENNVFCCQFNMRKVSRHILVPHGATYATKDSNFVVSDQQDFHPTDVIEDADGSLLILDTGGWYKLCCPSSQLVKPDVKGAIYRVKRAGAHQKAKGVAKPPAKKPLSRLYLISLNRDASGLGEALAALKGPDLHTRRLAAEALGRLGNPTAIPAILAALADDKNDRVLDHSLTYALIELADPAAVSRGLSHKSPRVRRAALAALDQMPGSKLEAKTVLGELNSPDTPLQETAWWIAGHHPQWGGLLSAYFAGRIEKSATMKPAARAELIERLGQFAKSEAIQKLLAKEAAADQRPIAFEAMARAGLKATPNEWFNALAAVLAKGRNARMMGPATRTARALAQPKEPDAEWNRALRLVAEDEAQRSETRLNAYAAMHPKVAKMDSLGLRLAIHQFTSPDAPGALRSAAGDAILRANLSGQQFQALAAYMKKFGPLDLPKILPAFAKTRDEKVGLALLATLSDPKVMPRVRAETIKPILDKYPKAVRTEAAKLYAKLADARKGETAKLEKLVKGLPVGDIRRGQAIFNGTKVQCAACHKIGYVGGLVGPDLTRVGRIRTDRDLLEAIVFPSASFVRSFEPVRVVTVDGRTFSGVIKKDAADEIIVTIAADKEERIARMDVENITPSTVSVMPDGLDKQLTTQDLADLVAFLRACK